MMLRRLMLYGMLAWASLGIGCRACQSTYDYTGPLPDEPSDFLYRKNSILGGDPEQPNEALTRDSEESPGEGSSRGSDYDGEPAESTPTDAQPELAPMPDPSLSTQLGGRGGSKFSVSSVQFSVFSAA